MRFSLIPRETKFFDMFEEVAAIQTRAAGKFMSMVTEFNHLTERSQELKEEEHACDEVVGRIIKALDQSFITPFDREDIHALSSHLDDVLDLIEVASNKMVLYKITARMQAAVELAPTNERVKEELRAARKLA